jgi:signal transduction histidine kinase
MKAHELLARIRPLWLERVSLKAGRGSDAQSAFKAELGRFYTQLESAVESGNPAWLDPTLVEWTSSPTLSELHQKKHNVAQLLDKFITITNDVALEHLAEPEALDLLTTVTPIYIYALEKIARLETEARVAHVSHELAQTQEKLERLDRSKSAFISIAAHELKTPLTLIAGYAAMLRETVDASVSPDIEVLLNGMSAGIERMQRIIKDLIDVSVIDNNLLSLNLQPMQLRHLFSQLRSVLEPVLGERQQTLGVEDFPGIETWVYADPDRLHQAFRNLLENAIKYTPDFGRIVVSGRTLPGFIEVTVKDSGIGIAPDNQTLIFEKHAVSDADLHSSSRSKFKGGGAGLGLAITRGIIQAHGGTIWAESEGYDEVKLPGSTFHVLIPARTQPINKEFERLFGTLIPAETKTDGETNPPSDPPPA